VIAVRRSETTLFTSREATHDNDTVALTHRAGLVRQFGSGLYGFTPTGERVRRRLIDAVDAELRAIGGQRISLPQLNYSGIWERSGRWGSFEGEMFTFENRDGKRLCLAPSHEEGVVHLVDGAVRSYEDLPALYYQVGRKHRDDHARNGLLRLKEFTMKDAYSLHADADSLDETYERVRAAYVRLFEALDLAFVVAAAENSVMGGSASEEFVAPVETGTLDLRHCTAEDCRFGVTDESPGWASVGGICPDCGGDLVAGEGIEIGHAFKLGTRYADAMDLTVDGPDGDEWRVHMGSYGIGIERLLHTILAQQSDDAGCRWPDGIAPFGASIVPLAYEGAIRETADRLYRELGAGETLLFDDPGQTIGERFAESDLLGVPRKVVLGNQFRETGAVELERRDGTTRYVDPDEVAAVVSGTRSGD
jgi:prolyl-tRNA synthetase